MLSSNEKKPILQYRKLPDSSYSVIARLWNPQKKFYEHPEFIKLNKKDVKVKIGELDNENISIDHIVENWTYIGD